MTPIALHNNVIIRKEAHTNITSYGLDITTESDRNEKFRKGTIFSKGENIPNTIKKGDVILFDEYRASKMTVEGVEYHVLNYNDVTCVL